MATVSQVKSLAQLTSNIFEVVKTNGTFLGRDCEVLTENPSIPFVELATSVEQVYDRVIAENPKPLFLELTALKGALRFYGWMVLFRNHDLSLVTCEMNPAFTPLIEKIDRACGSIAPDSELSSPLRRKFHQLYKEYSKISRDDFFQPQRLKEIRRILSLILLDEKYFNQAERYVFSTMPSFFCSRDYPGVLVDKNLTQDSVRYRIGDFANEPKINGWPASLIEALRELGDENFGLGLILSTILKYNKEQLGIEEQNPNNTGTKITLKPEVALEYCRVLSDYLKNPNLNPIIRETVKRVFAIIFNQCITRYPGKLPQSKEENKNKDAVNKEHFLVDTHSDPFPWESEGGLLYENMRILSKKLDEQKKIYYANEKKVFDLKAKAERLELLYKQLGEKKINLEQKLIAPFQEKKQLPGANISQIDRLLIGAYESLKKLDLEATDILKDELACNIELCELIESNISSVPTIVFMDLLTQQTYLEEFLLSFDDYERLYRMLHSRLFDMTGLAKDPKRRALDAQRPFFSIKTEPVFPETIRKVLEVIEPKIEQVIVAKQPAESKPAQKKKNQDQAGPSTSKSASLSIEPKIDEAKVDSLPVPLISLEEAPAEKKPQKGKSKEEPVASTSKTKQKEKAAEAPRASPAKTAPLVQLSYASWVSDWFTAPEIALARPQYANIQSYPKVLAKVQAYHTFPLEIDQLLFSHGVESTWQDTRTGKDLTHYSIPCEIEFWNDKEVQRGSIGYCANQRGEYFHRCFSQKAPNEMVSEVLQKGFWNVDFPALSNSLEKSNAKSGVEVLHHKGNQIRQINSYTIEIDDLDNQATIRIFNMKQFQGNL